MKKILQYPLVKILVGLIICYIPLLLVNILIMKPISASLMMSDETGRVIRFIVNSVLIFILYYWFIKWTEDYSSFDWFFKNIGRDMLIGSLLAIISVSFVILILRVINVYRVVNINVHFTSILYLIIIFAFMSILEEVLYRGVVYRIIENKLGSVLALIISGLFFGLFHYFNQDASVISVIAASIGGVLLGLMYTISRQLWMPIAFHWFWNFTQVFFGSRLSGSDEYLKNAVINADFVGADRLTGGKAGIENSYLTLLLTVILVFLLFYKANKDGKVLPFLSKKD
jgi:hypothetical protein